MGFVKFFDQAAETTLAGNGNQIFPSDAVLNVTAAANTCTIGFLASDGTDTQIECVITSTGNGPAIKGKVLDALRAVDGGGNVEMDMTDTETTTATAYNGYS